MKRHVAAFDNLGSGGQALLMGLVETEAIVIRSYKLGEADKIVSCLTLKAGLVRGVARGARRLKNRFGASLEPFTHLRLTYFEKEGRELVTLSQAEIVRSHFQLARQAEVVAALEYVGELALEFSPPGEPNERLFRLVNACVEALEESPGALDSVVRYYEVWLLKLSGLVGDLHHCRNCRQRLNDDVSLLNAEGALSCAACAQGRGLRLSAPTLTQLRLMLRQGPAAWARHATATAGASELGELTRRLIGHALERLPRGLRRPAP